MKCPRCSSIRHKITHTMDRTEDFIYRIRLCKGCDFTFSTREYPVLIASKLGIKDWDKGKHRNEN